MSTITVLQDEQREVSGGVTNGRAVVDAAELQAALGWELKPEGLCQADVCVPVADQAALMVDEQIDLGAVASALGASSIVDVDQRAIAISAPSTNRRGVVRGAQAPELVLRNIDDEAVSLADFRGRKTLLVAFASW